MAQRSKGKGSHGAKASYEPHAPCLDCRRHLPVRKMVGSATDVASVLSYGGERLLCKRCHKKHYGTSRDESGHAQADRAE